MTQAQRAEPSKAEEPHDGDPATPSGEARPLLEVIGVSKRFGRVLALDQVDFRCARGEIHALLGENGAGKSTLMHIVSGLHAAGSGTIRFAGNEVRWRSPEQARAAGIAMVHQHFMLVPTMTIAENIALARGTLGILRRPQLEAEVKALALAERLDIGDPSRRIEDLSVGEQQRVEILKALIVPVRLLILDEPTAVLTPDEVVELFAVLRQLAAQRTAIVLVTHKLVEALSLADRVTVLRSGRVRGGGPRAAFDERSLAALMVEPQAGATGEPRSGRAEHTARRRTGTPVLAAEHLTVRTRDGLTLLDDVSFSVAGGEILAVAGVEGNGQAELVSALAGTEAPRTGASKRGRESRGRVLLDGKPIGSAADARAAGLAVVPGDRRREGLVEGLAAWENLLLARDVLDRAAPHGWIRRDNERQAALALLARFAVRPPDPDLLGASFSGGNQQRIVLARELGRPAVRAVVAANPTRGLDITATLAIHRLLFELADSGAAVLVLSPDLDEVIALGDSIAVLYRGRLHGPFAQPASRSDIGRLMAGVGEAA